MINLPAFNFFMLDGKGSPDDPVFAEYIEILYALSYGVKMSPKKGITPKGYFEYSVYPLEGVWDISEEAKKTFNGKINKDTLVFNLMIRQPDFVTEDFARQIIAMIKEKKPHELLNHVKFGSLTDGICVQMLHLGSYDSEPHSFTLMEEYCGQQGLTRISKQHREIYLSDARKVSPEKLKTVLRYKVQK